VNHDLAPDRRHSLRQLVNTPAFASFDGVTGGMILDLSEEGMAMQTLAPLEAHSLLPLHLSLGEPTAYLETTGYVAWADALGRAGVRFSELPDKARERLREWLTVNAYAPSWKAPRWVVRDSAFTRGSDGTSGRRLGVALSLESGADATGGSGPAVGAPVSTTVQYEFKSLGGDLNAALMLIASRACSITRGTGAAVALLGEKGMTCRAAVGNNAPQVGGSVDLASGFSGACVREARALRCDNAEFDTRVDADICRLLGICSILAAPIIYERDLVGLVEVFSSVPYAFDEGDLAVAERMAQTVVLTLSRAEVFREQAQAG
jgi:GAF domain-containing protein/PilZ domain-containing protein